jgi:hypothetical protein
MRRDRLQDRFCLAVLPQKIESELEVRALQVPVDGLANVVQECCPRGDVAVEPELLRHDARKKRDFLRMTEDILPVARTELQPPHQAQHFGMQVVQPELECGRFPLLADGFLHVRFDFFDDLLDPRRMDAPVSDQALNSLPRDLAAERIEARENDRARRVVDDELDARCGFQRTDIASLAADDASFEIVAWQVDNRDGRLDGVLGGASLDGVGDDVLRADGGGLPRLRLEPLDEVSRVAAGIAFDLLQQQIACGLGRQPGDALQLALAICY